MKKIFLDTNFIYSNIKPKTIKEMLAQLSDNGIRVYVTEMNVFEIESLIYREVLEDYDAVVKKINGRMRLYTKFINETEQDNISLSIKKRVDKFFGVFFEDHVVKTMSESEVYISLMERIKIKQPPFDESKSGSDKGFKDTIIWLNIMDYAKENNSDEFYFITKDRDGFIKYKERLMQEFKTYTNTNINFIEASTKEEIYKYFKIDTKVEEVDATLDDLQINMDDKTPSDSIKKKNRIEINSTFAIKVQHTIEKLIYTEETDWNFNVSKIPNIRIYELINYEDAKLFCDFLLENYANRYKFISEISLSSLIKSLGLPDSREISKVDSRYIIEFAEMYKMVCDEFPDDIVPFVEAVKDGFNSCYEEIENVEEILF